MNVKSEQAIIKIVNEYLKVYKRSSYGKVSLLFLIFAIAAIGNFLQFVEFDDEEHIAEILLVGVIGNGSDTGSGYSVGEHLISAMNNEKAVAIVIEADSNGGSPTDSQIIDNIITQYKALARIDVEQLHRITEELHSSKRIFSEDVHRKANVDRQVVDGDFKITLNELHRKPIIAIVSKVCASACLQAIVNADLIIAQKASLIGNIGVRLDSLNWSTLAERLGVTNTVITSGPYKDMLSPWQKSSNEQLEIAKKMLVNPVFEQFKESVLSARESKLNIDHEVLFSGLVWTGYEAKRIGLVDFNSDKLQLQRNLESMTGMKYLPYSKSEYGLSKLLSSTLDFLGYK